MSLSVWYGNKVLINISSYIKDVWKNEMWVRMAKVEAGRCWMLEALYTLCMYVCYTQVLCCTYMNVANVRGSTKINKFYSSNTSTRKNILYNTLLTTSTATLHVAKHQKYTNDILYQKCKQSTHRKIMYVISFSCNTGSI